MPDSDLRANRLEFLKGNTALLAPPHVPEIMLHLATDTHPIWRQSEEDLAKLGISAPFWAFAWAGGQGLARFILDHPETVAGKRVVDFASGSGVVAIAAAKAGAASILATEIDPFCEIAITENANTNGVSVQIEIGDCIGKPIEADVMLAGDVFYERDMGGRVNDWFSDLRAQGADILVGDPGRYYFPKTGLTELASYSVPVSRELEDYEIKETRVWRFD